jgi:DNA processing protein
MCYTCAILARRRAKAAVCFVLNFSLTCLNLQLGYGGAGINHYMSGREFWLALASVEGVGPMRIKRLLDRFGTIDSVFEADLPEIARLPLFNPLLAARILKAGIRIAEFRCHIKWLQNRGIKVLCLADDKYPEKLKRIPDAPAILCQKGNPAQVSQQAVAIVGTTTPTESGILTTLEISTLLVEAGFIIVSGLAKGIDTSAHLGALSANAVTIGVLGCGLFSIYPTENGELANQICKNGALFSEHPFTTLPTPTNLILRNRIISGLSIATIVIESSEHGGAIHAAESAWQQNRLVFAFDWGQSHQLSWGTRRLIRRGAYPIVPNQLSECVDALCLKTQHAYVTDQQMELF